MRFTACKKGRRTHESKYIGGDESLTAEEAYAEYDPFGVFLEETHRYDIKFYVGLALYRSETSCAFNDPGWGMKSSIIAGQIAELEEKGADGYVWFSAQYLFRPLCGRGTFKCAEEPVIVVTDDHYQRLSL